jgi:SAM-dependent methyltransferase
MTDSCPVCAFSTTKLYTEQKWRDAATEFRLAICEQCGCAHTTPLPTDQRLKSLYSSSFDYRWYQDHFAAKLADCKLRLQEFSGQLGEQVLDFGGGMGYFSQAAREAGYESVTYDPFASDLPPPAGGKWNSVVALHVIEHANDLDRICEQFKKFLAPGGRLILAVPNFSGAGYRQLGMRWVWAQPPLLHIFHFTAAGLASLLTRHGFGDIQVSYHERWDANLYCDVEHAQRFQKWDSACGMRPLNRFSVYRRFIARLNSKRRFSGLSQSLRNFDSQSDIYSELQVTAVLHRP